MFKTLIYERQFETILSINKTKENDIMKIKTLTKTAIISAVYCILTLVLAPISYGVVQFRVSEVMTVLPRFTKSSIIGLSIGCLLANYVGMAFMGSVGVVDVVFGTLATFLAAVCSYIFKKNKYLVALFPPLFNGIIVGGYLHFLVFENINLICCILSVALGEAVITYVMGIMLINYIEKNSRIGEIIND